MERRLKWRARAWRGFFPATAIVVASMAVGAADANAHGWKKPKKPNFIVILADDLGQDAFALTTPKTADPDYPINAPVPALAKLASKGVLFENGWAMPGCSITRGARTMGLLPSSSGLATVIGNPTPRFVPEGDNPFPGIWPEAGTEFPPSMLNPSDPGHLQKILKKAGYSTFKVGKWHETQTDPAGALFGPNGPQQGDDDDAVQDVLDSGFDSFVGIDFGLPITGWGGSFLKNDLGESIDFHTVFTSEVVTPGTPTTPTEYGEVTTTEYLTNYITTVAIEQIKNRDPKKPYFMALDYLAPHFAVPADVYEIAPGPNEPLPPGVDEKDFLRLDPVIHADVIQQVKDAFAGQYGGAYPPAGAPATIPMIQDPNGEPGDMIPEFEGSVVARRRAAFKSLISYMDLQIGRLLKHVDLKDTYVLFIGDNGTQGGGLFGVVEAPNDTNRSKNTLYLNGVAVPFIVAGPKIYKPGRTTKAPATVTDVLATLADLARIRQPAGTRRDSISFKRVLQGKHPRRRYNVAERFNANRSVGGVTPGPGGQDGRVVANDRFRLIAKPVIEEGTWVCLDGSAASPATECFNPKTGIYEKKHALEFYDLKIDPFEEDSLVYDEITDYAQYYGFVKLCKELNRVSRRAKYFQNGYICDWRTGDNLIDIDPAVEVAAD